MTESRRCSFCGIGPDDSLVLLGGLGENTICSECIEVCEDIIDDDRTFYAPYAPFAPKVSPEMLDRVEQLSWLELEAARGMVRDCPPRPSNSGLTCGFCAASNSDGRALIAGPSIVICGGCVTLLSAVLLEPQGLHVRGRLMPPPLSPEDEVQRALAEAERARAAELFEKEWRRRGDAAEVFEKEWRRRCDAQWAALVAAAGAPESVTAKAATHTNQGPRIDLSLRPEIRDVIERDLEHVASRCRTLLIVGGSRAQQRELACRVHERSGEGGPLTCFDSSDPTALVPMFEAPAGTVVLEDVTALSVANQCVLFDRLISHGLQARLVSTAVVANTAALCALVAARRFSETLYYRLNIISLQL